MTAQPGQSFGLHMHSIPALLSPFTEPRAQMEGQPVRLSSPTTLMLNHAPHEGSPTKLKWRAGAGRTFGRGRNVGGEVEESLELQVLGEGRSPACGAAQGRAHRAHRWPGRCGAVGVGVPPHVGRETDIPSPTPSERIPPLLSFGI